MKENRSVTFIQKTVGLGNKDLLKSLLFWLTCAVYFFYHWGIDTPQGEIIAMLTRLDFGGSIAKLLFYVLSQPIGQALGMFIAWIVRKVVHGEKNRPDDDHAHKDSRLTHIFGLLVATAFTMSIGCFVAPEAVNFEYFFTFSLLFATFFGMNEGFRDYVVPEEFGRDNVRIVEGLILMCVGLGGLITNEITLKIDDWKRGFRYGGGMLLLSGSVTTIVLALKQSKALDEIQSKINGNSVVPLRADGNRTNVPGTQQTGPSTLTHNTVNKQPSVGPITNTSRQQTVPSTFNGSFQPYRQSNVPTSSQNSGVQPYRQSTQGYANQNGGFHPPQQTIGVQHISVYDM
ncbi:uncharacterized protein LOC132759482 [Ruditapes philippinarum]|uniref:uncharacterized protein LOC132759482 n=1 Tax=Ruditapes philippinarum TaxID=129788 RepID=UPI00295ABB01|nr:uncharacterized protein LOC132759482 [Ruditapes philippinarum]